MTESNTEFIKAITFPDDSCSTITLDARDYRRLLALAEERVMIEEHKIAIGRTETQWECYEIHAETESSYDTDLSTAIHAVVTKIGDGNG